MLCPTNKYLVVEPILEEKKSGILIPDEYEVNNSAFSLVKLLATNTNSKLEYLSPGARLVVPAHMIETIDLFGEKYHVVLENHVIGFFNN